MLRAKNRPKYPRTKKHFYHRKGCISRIILDLGYRIGLI